MKEDTIIVAVIRTLTLVRVPNGFVEFGYFSQNSG